jgi:hypothetical protein
LRVDVFVGPAVRIAPVPLRDPGSGSGTVVGVEFPSASAVVNACAPSTGVSVPAQDCLLFDMAWELKFRKAFSDLHRDSLVRDSRASASATRTLSSVDEASLYVSAGTSCGRPLQLQVMALPPHQWFKVHAHPNIEWELTLAGCLKEIRSSQHYPAQLLAAGADGDDDDAAATALADGRWLDAGAGAADTGTGADAAVSTMHDMRAMQGPPHAAWTECAVPAGEHLANSTGSLHQSFTGPEGAVLLILWSGQHANIPSPAAAAAAAGGGGGGRGETAGAAAAATTTGGGGRHYYDPRLRPGAGWAL